MFLRRSQVIGVPVGAGPYMASTESGKWDGDYPVPNQFLRNNRVYYERNPYFDTVDGVVGGTIQNAKIKYLQYTVINTNFLLDSLIEGEIDVGAPNATQQNINRLNSYQDTLTSNRIMTNGYGYVGINAGKIPDVWLRRGHHHGDGYDHHLQRLLQRRSLRTHLPPDVFDILGVSGGCNGVQNGRRAASTIPSIIPASRRKVSNQACGAGDCEYA